MQLEKPQSIIDSPFKSTKWDEITQGREFTSAHVPTLVMLCHWYEVVEKCIEDITYADSIQVAYQNDRGDISAMPQLSTMKQASAEIRALNKQLGINDTATQQTGKGEVTKLDVIRGKRQKRKAGTAS